MTMPKLMVKDYLKPRVLGLSVAAVVIVLDAASKAWALWAKASHVLPVWLNVLGFGWGEIGFHFAWNRGMSFSLLDGVAWGPWLLATVAVVASGWFIHWLGEEGSQEPGSQVAGRWRFHQIGLGLLIGGAIGNLLDRAQHGAVVDFLVLNPWGLFPYTFNIADVAITFGVVLLLLDSWLRRP